MAEVAITLKLGADEFQTLREELRAHAASLREGTRAAKDAGNLKDSQELVKREARVRFILERLG